MRSFLLLVVGTVFLLGTVGSVGLQKAEAERGGYVTFRVVGKPVVLWDDYGLPGTTGYQTSVAFRVQNPSRKPIYEAQYRVTVSGSGRVLDKSDGNDTLSLRARETRWIVYETDVEGTKPVSARVTFYPAYDQTANAPPIASTSLWTLTDRFLDCQDGFVGCEATGDLTWRGKRAAYAQRIHLVVHSGSLKGPIVAAGAYSFTGTKRASPRRPFPLSMRVYGLAQHPEASNTRGEFFVEGLQGR